VKSVTLAVNLLFTVRHQIAAIRQSPRRSLARYAPAFCTRLMESTDSHGQAMIRNSIDRGGFGPSFPSCERRHQRTALSLFAGLALAICTVVAVTVVSIGIAQAEILVATQSGGGSLAVAFVAGSIVGGGIVGAIYRRRQQLPY
jgi:hypothetical protein